MARLRIPSNEDAIRPREVIEFTLESLQVGAVIVTSFERRVLYVNRCAVEVLPQLRPEADIREAFVGFGWDWEHSAAGQLLEGDADVDDVRVRGHAIEGGTLFTVASWLPEVVDWSPVVLVTTHDQPRLSHRAVERHLRDRLAVVQAILLDQMLSEQRESAAAAARSYARTNNLVLAYMRRTASTQAELPQD